jgi:hypothetical protein
MHGLKQGTGRLRILRTQMAILGLYWAPDDSSAGPTAPGLTPLDPRSQPAILLYPIP